MKILVVGSGGREHAFVWKLAQSEQVKRIWCAPGNGGTQQEMLRNGTCVENVPIGESDVTALCQFARDNHVDLAVIGPFEPLSLGLVDRLRETGIMAFGPTQECAQFGKSSTFAHDFLSAADIPIVDGDSFTDLNQAIHYAQEIDGACVIRSVIAGNANGSIICYTHEEATETIRGLFISPGKAEGGEIFIQHHVEGTEASFHYLVDGQMLVTFPSIRSYKFREGGNRGCLTHGMGACLPHRLIHDPVRDRFKREVVTKWLNRCAESDMRYKGSINPEAVIGDDGVLRLHSLGCVFGDPEAQLLARMFIGDLLSFLTASANGGFYSTDGKLAGPHWKPGYCVCVVLTAEEYPNGISTGRIITGIENAMTIEGVRVFHSGTTCVDGKFYTNGGRVLSVTARGFTPNHARDKVYDAVSRIRFDGMDFRRDIAEDLCFI